MSASDSTLATAAPRRQAQALAWVRERRASWQSVAVGASVVAWFALLSALSIIRHHKYLTGRFDLGNMVQAVWSTAHGRPLEVTLVTGEQTVRLASHADVFLVALAPLWMLFPSPVTLLVVQAAALALGALPVYWLARKHLGSETPALLMAWAYLLYPWVGWAATNDFHSIAVGSCFLAFAIWALDSNRLVLFAVFAIAAMTTHELVGLLVAGLGVWYAATRGHRRAGLLIALGGLAWTVVCLELVIPHFAPDGHSQFYGRFASTGGSPAGIIETVFQDPMALLRAVTTPEDVLYLFLLVLPLAGLVLLAPSLLLAASPLIAMNLLSDWWATTNPIFQYTTPLVPFLLIATVFGVRRFSPGRVRGAATVAIAAALSFAAVGPTVAVVFYDLPEARSQALRAAVALVPDSGKVSSTESVGAELSKRRVIYSFPMIRDAEWIVVDRRDVSMPDLPTVRRGPRPNVMAAAFERLERDPRFRLVFSREKVEVYRRATATS